MLDLSVVIVNWNTCDLLRTCLSSLYRFMEGIAYDVFVVDNASSDGSPDMVTQEFPAVHIIRNTENVGFSKANNQALRLTSSRYVLLLNSDTELRSPALPEIVSFMDQHPSVGICGTKLLHADGTWQYSCDVFPRKPMILLRDKLANLCLPGNSFTREGKMVRWDYHNNFPVDYVIGAVLCIRGETLVQIGLLDEQSFMYAEDIDWCYRARLAGWEVDYVGTISIYHYNKGSSAKSPELSTHLHRMREQSLLQFYKKHYGVLAACTLNVLMFCKRCVAQL
jgi:GT2 family glycosyltransferase